jgi:hypothetical protein
MFHAFLAETGYFYSNISIYCRPPNGESLANVGIRKKYLPYRVLQAIVQDNDFSSGAWDRA